MTLSLEWIAGALVGAMFLISGTIELLQWRKFVEQFVAWGYPAYWTIVTFALKAAGGAMVFIPQTRVVGLALCALISLAAIATLLRKYKRSDIPAIAVNLVLLVLVVTALI